jgi:hypothetical protein
MKLDTDLVRQILLKVGARKPLPAVAARKRVIPGRNEPPDYRQLNFARRKRDSNPRVSYPTNGFQDRRLRPLGHSSISTLADSNLAAQS